MRFNEGLSPLQPPPEENPALNERSQWLPFKKRCAVRFDRSRFDGAADTGTARCRPRPRGSQPSPATRADPRTRAVPETRAARSCGPGGRDQGTASHHRSTHRLLAPFNRSQLGVPSGASSSQRQLLPCLSSSTQPFCRFLPFDTSQRGQDSFFMGMTEKPVMTCRARVNKPQAKI